MTIEEKASLLTLSTEIRFMIYDHIVVGKGTVSVFSQHDIASEVDTTTVYLLHVNKLIRSEVQEFFYKSQTFEFRSAPALNKLAKKIGHYHASIIKNIKLGDWLCRKKLPNFTNNITPAFRHSLRGIEKLTISDPSVGYACHDSLDELPLDPSRSHFLEHFRDLGFPPKVEEVNPQWVLFNQQNVQYPPPGWPHGWPLPHNPYEKTICTKFQELAIPSVAAMEAALACALAPVQEHDCTFSDPMSRIETNGFDNAIVLSDEDSGYNEDTKKQDEERVIADSDEIDND
ncbi:hypothetical protein LTR70_004250 [Exophiala xenobiotica]|uniref:Uncharacterized protein n=1 Tax=Lithohypha guttulata TaxID=1690604 RepID=A0ABR0KG14_9EURO|nr:hypothetical protein LTR24_003783 [Lithohypha guttulata]KAK5321005.1 hypothetical protein LTR70_004250 [Exophiala xenobiotica]